MAMPFRPLAETYDRLEATSSRLEMTDILAAFFRQADASSIRKAIYLTQGQLYPDFCQQKLGVADKLLIKALAFVSGRKEAAVQEMALEEGDLGSLAERLLVGRRQTSLFAEELTLERVHTALERVSSAEGSGSQDMKIKLLADVLQDASPIEGKYICRVVTGKMRLGAANMTTIDALATAFASKAERGKVERAFNITSDLGLVGEVLARDGMPGIEAMHVRVNNPIRVMLGERMASPQEILAKMGGSAAFEYKYDGVRAQAHITPEGIRLYSRRMEDLTGQFPDVVEALRSAFQCGEAILEGECVPVDINTGEFLPFQEVSHRRGRKHGLEEAVEEYPVRICLFDLLYLEGQDLTGMPYLKRRAALSSSIKESEQVRMSEMRLLSSPDEVDAFFQEALRDGCEGLMAKSIGEDSTYRAGARAFQWIKYKKEYRSEMTDTVDLVVVGAFAGRGKRKGFYGALLMATYDEERDNFQTVSKLGSGFTDADLAAIPPMLEKAKLEERHHLVDSRMTADYWFEPQVVMEVLGAEITVSPVHTCAFGKVRKDAGLAVRFPRFTGKYRSDKGPREATSSAELESMYRGQLKKVEE
jgi:DNA ligase-1